MQMDLKGVFCLPTEWKTSDESNPSQFEYSLRFSKIKNEKGHYCAREASEQELREQEELLKNKNKKDLKGAQQTMMQEQPSEEEKERLEQERLEQEAWDQLDPEEQFRRTQETHTKSSWVGWEDLTKQTVQLEAEALIQFEERVIKDGGEWLYLVKEPTLNKEEVEKLKKSKPKGINLGDLQAVYFRGWLDYSQFQEG